MSVILATAGHDDKIRFWEAPSGVCSRILRYADSQVNCLEITREFCDRPPVQLVCDSMHVSTLNIRLCLLMGSMAVLFL